MTRARSTRPRRSASTARETSRDSSRESSRDDATGDAIRPADVLTQRSRFMRSVHLARDFHDPHALDDFIVTPTVAALVGQIMSGLHPDARRRAWRITGDYGTGKSALLLAMARLLAPGASSALKPTQAQKTRRQSTASGAGSASVRLATSRIPASLSGLRPSFVPQLEPVLVVGKRADLGITILQAVAKHPGVVSLLHEGRRGRRPSAYSRPRGESSTARAALRDALEAAMHASTAGTVDPQQVVAILEHAACALREAGRADGVFLVLDELGKFLEHAAAVPSAGDVLLLQELAEAATRLEGATLAVVGLLHQGVQSYADGLPPAAQREWAKVAGRFEELALAPPLSSTAALIAGALGVQRGAIPAQTHVTITRVWKRVQELPWLAGLDAALLDPAGLYPMHPVTLSALVAVMRRLAQNERSVFGCLLSEEPHSVAVWARQTRHAAALYTLAELFDYIRANADLGAGTTALGVHWPRATAIVDALQGADTVAVDVAKAVAVISLIEADGVRATPETLVAALADVASDDGVRSPNAVKRAINALLTRGVLHDRGKHAGLALWPHSSVNLATRLEEVLHSDSPRPTLPAVTRLVRPAPIVARRHFITSGTLRHFAVRLVTATELRGVALADWPGHLQPVAVYGRDSGRTRPDGEILICLAERREELAYARELATTQFAARGDVLIGLAEPLGGLADAVRLVDGWEAVVADTPAQVHDEFARAEAHRQLAQARSALESRLQEALGLSDARRVEWWRCGARMPVEPTLSRLVSTVCDQLYADAPRLRHELINRRSLSTAAARARVLLIEGLFEGAHLPEFGFTTAGMPPERSIYRSLFHAGRLHKQIVPSHNGQEETAPDDVAPHAQWRIAMPGAGPAEDPLALGPTFRALQHQCDMAPNHRIPVRALYDILRAPPLGVRDGLIPILLAHFIACTPGRVALYENGTFLRGIDAKAFMRLMKDPRDFELQLYPDAPVHHELYARLANVLHAEVAVPQLQRPAGAVVDVVKALFRFLSGLPDYARRTTKVSAATIRVRRAIESARDPMALLLDAVPAALEVDAVPRGEALQHRQVDQIVTGVAMCVRELSTAYPDLIARVVHATRRAFDVPLHASAWRAALKDVGQRALDATTDLRLRGLCLRLRDNALADMAWAEALGSFVLERPPARWRDGDEAAFAQEVHALAKRLERAILARSAQSTAVLPAARMALVLTTATGEERALVVPDPVAVSAKTLARAATVRDALGSLDHEGIAALSTLLWEALGQDAVRAEDADLETGNGVRAGAYTNVK